MITLNLLFTTQFDGNNNAQLELDMQLGIEIHNTHSDKLYILHIEYYKSGNGAKLKDN